MAVTILNCKCGADQCKAEIKFSFITNNGHTGEITLDANDLVDLIKAAKKELIALVNEDVTE